MLNQHRNQSPLVTRRLIRITVVALATMFPCLLTRGDVDDQQHANAADSPVCAVDAVQADSHPSILEMQKALALVSTASARYEGARSQLEAIKKVYEAKTTTIDQLLEVQRRCWEREVEYARALGELCHDSPRKQLIVAAAKLKAAENAAAEAKATWKMLRAHTPGRQVESADEAQVREQYIHFIGVRRMLLDECFRAESRVM